MATIPESHRDLLDGAHVGSLSTLGKDGAPQVTALWYLAEGDSVVLSLTTDRQKYKNAVQHPRATLFVIDPTNPFRTLEVRGDTSVEEDPGLAVFDRIVRHYGQDPDTFPAPRDNRVVLRLTPTRVVANG
ncbi:PPOX class F420-dependent oxidoreductase [Mycolicibacterium sp. P9-22]|uniref:PPOX class F420-dependent oxidoreductase n=1 Tax=Mycolicibacterium sp. P9-22 TaxID=2024613 RepID=UPI0011EE8001|nr:PPOX class F420-dependent oxidoreductase [Mycolicibacterium sp. P9-22]KAA0115235.1 PPOX class F420-dependent oxidoreductase [Mycolicibacterium sp. P9-22]